MHLHTSCTGAHMCKAVQTPGACCAGKMAILEIACTSVEQLQLLLQLPAVKGAFVVYICREATLAASLAASGAADATVATQLEKAVAQQREFTSTGLVQVRS